MKLRKTTAALIAALASPLAFSDEAAKLTGYFGADLSGGYTSGINLGDQHSDLGQGLFPSYNWNIWFGFSGDSPIKIIDSDIKIIFGADFTSSKPVGKSAVDPFKEDVFGSAKLNKSIYIGIASATYGKLKIGDLSTNSLGLSPDFWSTGGVANLTLYKRTFFPVTNAILYESPDFDGLSFHLIKGLAKRIQGIWTRPQNQEEALFPILESINAYGGTVQYQKNGHFIKYTGLVRQDGLLQKKANDEELKHDGFLHRIEGGSYQGSLFLGVGYQYLYNNAGWGDTTPFMKDDEIKQFTGQHPTNYGDTTAYGVKYFAFPMHEIALSASYSLGKLTPKASIVFGKGAANSYAIAGFADSQYNLPGYLQYVIGADYALSGNLFLNLGYGNLTWQHKEDTEIERKWFDQESVLLNLSYWF